MHHIQPHGRKQHEPGHPAAQTQKAEEQHKRFEHGHGDKGREVAQADVFYRLPQGKHGKQTQTAKAQQIGFALFFHRRISLVRRQVKVFSPHRQGCSLPSGSTAWPSAPMGAWTVRVNAPFWICQLAESRPKGVSV